MILTNEIFTKITLPVNLAENDIELFQKKSGYKTSSTKLLSYKNAFLFDNGIILNKGKYVPQSIYPFYTVADFGKRFIVKSILTFHKNILSRKKEYIVAFDCFSDGYFHWFCETLPRIYLYKKYFSEHNPQAVLLIPEIFNRDYHQFALQALDIKNISYLKKNSLNFVSKLSLVPLSVAGNQPMPLFSKVVEELKKLRRPLFKGDKIYISRAKAQFRKIINEDEVTSYLLEKGFTVLHFEDIPFLDQVSIMGNARYLISIHGGGLTNMMFMNAGGSVMELKMENDQWNYCYYAMASAVQLKYYYQFCTPNDSTLEVHKADLHVNIDDFKRNIELMLKE